MKRSKAFLCIVWIALICTTAGYPHPLRGGGGGKLQNPAGNPPKTYSNNYSGMI